ncbi:RecF/RecN/SMC N terminal domain-containing protein [Pisolithus orientalis]|uniref:RecF/RecN/SMC N terminal domain-containing protein n=1 Tax=Pisolithus orientalis TaxID=936130 RepID=UPI0022255AFE|nr:RecF/RecN/SMC N terminal domain-containing protein [Pisolithus orientalis]KAI6012790.1 RecF/RecN/SMC N terminal domain-containing protein [Pisolithus orientalis]
MPPRRSSRSTRASAEPAPAVVPTSSGSKRKRGVPSRASRSTRASARGGNLREVEEEEGEEEEGREEDQATEESEAPRARKKSRNSTEKDEEDEEEVVREEEDEEPPKKPGRGKRGKAVAEVKEEEEEVKPASRSRRTSAKPPSSRATTRASRKPVQLESDVEEVIPPSEDDSDDDVLPVPKGRKQTAGKSQSRRGRPRQSSGNAPSDQEEPTAQQSNADDAGDASTPRPRNSFPSTHTRKLSHSASRGYDGDDLDGFDQTFKGSPMRSRRQDAKGNPPSQSTKRAALAIQISPAEEPSGPRSRLVIHKMALVNFKSYAGRQEIGPFHKSFSAIVGPNGSGKSNTIDALLFVFGYRASKMRQGKLSELIHNSARYPDLDECSVEVHFRDIIDLPGPDAYKVVPDSNLVVARIANKNNQSKYTINGRHSSFTEVQALLKGRGIDLDHKRFLILQGEVESIAQMKPKAQNEHEDGLLEYLEDIIGTSAYKAPIEEALAAMEALSEDRAEKLNRLRIVEREKSALEAQRREALDYLRLYNDSVRAKSRLWQWYLWKCLDNEEKYNEQIERIEKELATEREQNKGDIEHLNMLEQHFVDRQKAYEEVKAAAEEAIKDQTAHEKQVVSLEERRKHTSTKAKKLKKSLQDDEHAQTEAQRTIKEYKTQVFHDQIEIKQKELQPWTAKINAKKASIDVATSEREALLKKVTGLKDAVKDAEADLETKRANLEEKAAMQGELQAHAKTFRDAQARVQELRSKANSLRQRTDDARASQAANTSQNRVLDHLTRLKQTGRIDGFHGRLGSLGTIPDKYDVAVSTACGALHNMVVDTVEQGQACINSLRTQNVGRASFMVLEKLATDKVNRKDIHARECTASVRLDHTQGTQVYPGVLQSCRNTLVANDLDQANRIAFGGAKRWRVVTLAGQLIDASGTMSGGGTHVARGGMSSKLAPETVRPEVLRAWEQESEEAARSLEEAQKDLRSLEAEAERLTQAGPKLDMDIEKSSLDIKNGRKRVEEAEQRVRDLNPDARDVARIDALEREISSSTKEFEQLQAKSGTIESAIKDLEKKILEIGGSRLLKQKSTVDGIKLHINLANDEITKAEVAKAKAEKDELDELTQQLAEVAEYLTELKSKEHSKDDLEDLKTQLETKREEIKKFREKEMELNQSLNDVKKEAAANEEALNHWQTEHDKLKIEEIDDDDEDDEEAEADAEGQETAAAENAEPKEPQVKDEPEEHAPPPPKKSRQRQSSTELHIYSSPELAQFRRRDLVADSEYLDEKIKNAKPNLGVLKDYKKREEEFMRRAKDLEQITEARDAQKLKYDTLRKQRLDEFMAGFNLISLKLKEMYQMITLGGNAELELVDSMDPFSEGIIFSVMPPKKSWKNISNLSGGEKTLSSLALVFALHVFKPTPLYFMDEIDAALDFRNVSIVANYIKDRTKNAQFIIISLRNDMFELSHRLIGIYKTANATQSIAIDNQALTVVRPPMAAA